jgi:hypothetical protein
MLWLVTKRKYGLSLSGKTWTKFNQTENAEKILIYFISKHLRIIKGWRNSDQCMGYENCVTLL